MAHLSIPVAEAECVMSGESGVRLMMEASGEVSGYLGGESVTTDGGLRISTSPGCFDVSLRAG